MSADPSSKKKFLGLALASTGVVYGDIGTSPLYALKESVARLPVSGGLPVAADVIGVVSLMLWALMIIVTVKYILFLTRFANRGEGGTLSLMALVQRAGGRGGTSILIIGMVGAGLFVGDAMLTPAVSVLSAVEGLAVIEPLQGRLDSFILPMAMIVLVVLFAVQRRGTGGIGRWFGPVCLVWFLTLAVLGAAALMRAPQVLAALNPLAGALFLIHHPAITPAVLGAVFLTVTGAEALYADMGHFGRRPIAAAWSWLVFPCLALNYLGQGALVMTTPGAAANPFFLMAPEWFQIPLVILATAATVIASQAVISGAFSMVRQAVQLGLLPRMAFKLTSEEHEGQIYAPLVNWILAAGVCALVLTFRSSSALASAYGVSVVGAMITSTLLAVVAVHRLKGRPIWLATLMLSPFLVVEAVFGAANLLKLFHGGYVPLLIAAACIAVMTVWMRGAAALARAERRDVSVVDLLAMLADRPPLRAKGTAVFLTADPEAAPVALLHNLKHNQVLHEQLVLLTVRVARTPYVAEADRAALSVLAPGVKRVILSFGYMETPDVAKGLAAARALGLKYDIMRTSFFLSRRTVAPIEAIGLRRVQLSLFLFLMRNAERAADYFRIPPSRVVELGAQVVL